MLVTVATQKRTVFEAVFLIRVPGCYKPSTKMEETEMSKKVQSEMMMGDKKMVVIRHFDNEGFDVIDTLKATLNSTVDSVISSIERGVESNKEECPMMYDGYTAANPAFCIKVNTDAKDQKYSMEYQKEKYASMCVAKDWGEPKFYCKVDRQRFDIKGLIDDIKNGEIDLVVTKTLSTISRKQDDFRDLTNVMNAHSVGLLLEESMCQDGLSEILAEEVA